jgi:uncharacterized protein (DUF2267 family)
MTATHLDLYDRTLNETNAWIDDVEYELETRDPKRAFQALRAVFHALREELSIEQNAQLSAQLPTLLRGIYFEAWKPKLDVRHSDIDTFLDRVGLACEGYAPLFDPAEIATSVFAVLERQISGECRKIRATLPKELRELWPET